jgi:PAS domain S-box-containing protein
VSESAATILVVDDEEMNRDMLGRRLQRAGYSAVLAADGTEALAVLDRQPIDLVLLDIMMPGLSGHEVLRRVRDSSCHSHMPVILVTARAATEDVVEGLELGADDYITKPIDFAVALARIRTQLARRRAEVALFESEERYALAVQGTNDGVWDWGVATGRFYCSPRWKTIMGYGENDEIQSVDGWFQRVHPDDGARVRGELDEHVQGHTEHLESEHRIRCGESYRWILVRGRAVRDGDGTAIRVAGSVTDITEGKVADALTGLPNRVLFNDRLGRLFEYARRVPEFQFAVLFLDLDRFKNVNDSLGHRAGDALLVQTARRLERNLRSSDSVSRLPAGEGATPSVAGHTLARFGGDEFAIILGGVRHPTDATRVADRIGRSLAEGYQLEGQEVFVSASIGIALSVTGYDRPEDMLRDADTALYRAKAAGRGRYELFDNAMREQVVQRLQLETDLRHAVRRNEFVVHYQPIIALASGSVIGLEALVRWQHPTRGLLLPAEFIPAAEETGLILPIGAWVIEEVCRQIADWRERHGGDMQPVVSINLSVKQLLVPDFVEKTTETIDAARVPHDQIEFEITETVLMTDPEGMRATAERLKAFGFRITIDDFGTGYSSLSYLQRFPVDRLKLDRSFLEEVGSQVEAQAIMESVVLLADHLKLEVVAEGIETSAQLQQVQSLNCPFGQGFLFARPCPAPATRAWMADRRTAAAAPGSGG